MGDSGSNSHSDRAGDRMMDADDMHVDIASMPGITTGGLGSGDMTLDIKPVRFRNGRLEVKYSANTHSVNLGNYDLMELSTMEADGKVYRAVQADPMRGHHAKGKIVFEVSEQPDHFRIVIHDIPHVMERSYEWN